VFQYFLIHIRIISLQLVYKRITFLPFYTTIIHDKLTNHLKEIIHKPFYF
jgi:hypothetical protein